MSIERKIIQFVAQGEVAIITEPLSGPTANQVMVEHEWSLVSAGTELTCLHRRFAPNTHWDEWMSYPHSPGYSTAGKIVALGENAAEHWAIGDRVALRGGHASHVCAEMDEVYRIPENLPSEQAAWIGLLKIVQVGVRTADVKMGAQAVVVGCGILGQLAVQYLSLAGCETIVAIDTNTSRLEIARANGATHTISTSIADAANKITEACGGQQPDVVIDVTGSTAVLPHCLETVRDFGKVVLLGDPGNPAEQHITKDIILRGVQLLGAHDSHPAMPFTPHTHWTTDKIINYGLRLVAKGKINVSSLSSHQFSARDAIAAYELASDPARDNLGILLDWETINLSA